MLSNYSKDIIYSFDDPPFCQAIVCRTAPLRSHCWDCPRTLHHCQSKEKALLQAIKASQSEHNYTKSNLPFMVDLVDIGQKYVHFEPPLYPGLPTENQCPIQILRWKCKCECKWSEKLQCLVPMVNASTCMRAAVAFISPLAVTDVCERHGWAEPSKVASDRHTATASWDTHTHTLTHTHTGLLTVTFDVKVEASDIYAGGFIKVGPGRSSGGKDHSERI